MGIPILILIIFVSLSSLLAGQTLLHWFQLESYQFPGFFRTLKRNLSRAALPGVVLAVVFTGISLILHLARIGLMSMSIPVCISISLCELAAGVVLLYAGKKNKAKKPMVYTPRMKRLQAVCFIVFAGVLYGLTAVFRGSLGPIPLFLALLPLDFALGGLLAWPIEKLISEMYFRDAQRILRERKDLIRIGITGSWGKTSVKFILGTLLSEKYSTLITPASYNTPMGVTRIIRTRLEPGYRIFVAEMGARHVGDIREMCRLVHPTIGILTSVGPQHLDTFKTLDRIKKTKYELIDAIPADGQCFFADDGGIVRELYQKTEKNKILAGMNAGLDDVWAENLQVTPEGSSFVLCTRNERMNCRTELLGELNIRNIVLCAAVCLKLDMTLKEIARGIGKLQSVEHRLQLIRNKGGVTVIDDAFNSNIQGASQAFHVLKEFPGKRIVVTPGMVELGNREAEMNREFGRNMSGCCDLAVLIGKKHTAVIAEGLKEEGFPEHNIVFVNSLGEATEYLATAVQKGDTILFENDLPDNYQET